jgi:hypothetical protein
MATYRTPGVYVEEISTLPPSVAEVATAVPAFIGCTERAQDRVERITTLLEYESIFGGAQPSPFAVDVTRNSATGLHEITAITNPNAPGGVPNFSMYYALKLYFANGGGPCYIISIGDYSAAPTAEAFEAGLERLKKEDEPTLIVLVDGAQLLANNDYSQYQAVLDQCNTLGDRFAIFDVLPDDEDASAFRQGLTSDYLKYGAAYYPYLRTTLTFQYTEDGAEAVQVQGLSDEAAPGDTAVTGEQAFGANGIMVRYTGAATDTPTVTITEGAADDDVAFTIDAGPSLTINNVADKTGTQIADAWAAVGDAQGFEVVANGDGSANVAAVEDAAITMPAAPAAPSAGSLAAIKSSHTALYNLIKAALAQERVVLPPSSAIAGVYARVDRDRGVWKAPANVSLAAVIGPTVKITNEVQDRLNVDPTAGKSINAIRAFSGKGTLVWGARTLAGNDNEWRYVSVRRLFNTIQESTAKATAFAVFEPNDATTWLKVKAMIEAYLFGLWQQGALAGPTPEAAYFVNVGLGKTMTTQDILEGRMIVEIGIAAVRPAEFIILRFMHKLQEA